jgi:hypothetical protein
MEVRCRAVTYQLWLLGLTDQQLACCLGNQAETLYGSRFSDVDREAIVRAKIEADAPDRADRAEHYLGEARAYVRTIADRLVATEPDHEFIDEGVPGPDLPFSSAERRRSERQLRYVDHRRAADAVYDTCLTPNFGCASSLYREYLH